MKQLYIAIGVLVFSLALFSYASYANSVTIPQSCNHHCGSESACENGDNNTRLEGGWSGCSLNVPGAPGGCATHGNYC